jgi:hypothetical protein
MWMRVLLSAIIYFSISPLQYEQDVYKEINQKEISYFDRIPDLPYDQYVCE